MRGNSLSKSLSKKILQIATSFKKIFFCTDKDAALG